MSSLEEFPVHPTMRREGITVKHIGDELLVYDRRSNKAHSLNAASAFVFHRCDGRNSEIQIARQLQQRTGAADAASLVSLALDQLRRRDLLESAEPAPTPSAAERLSRRDALRQLAAAAIALPVIATMTPKASAAVLVSPKKPCPLGTTQCGGRSTLVICCEAREICDTSGGTPKCVPALPPAPVVVEG